MSEKGITKKKHEDIVEWYEQVCLKSELADFGEVKGTIVIRPKGYYIWQQIQEYINTQIQTNFHVDNCSFPMLIPNRFFVKEAEHAQGFAPELAWLEYPNREKDAEKIIIRPTSETIIVDSFKKWLRNYRQLPIKVNQWCNILRWEVKQTKLFLRSREFLWQEGHCIYQTNDDCQKDVVGILDMYTSLCKDVLAIPVISGEKTPAERFPGAVKTYTIEGLMPDGKALQMGTSHNLGQGFMKGFGVEYMDDTEQKQYPFYNSWGVSTRLLGGVIMTHSDDKGLVLPPKLVKNKVVIIPIRKKNQTVDIDSYVQTVTKALSSFHPIIDDSQNHSVGFKMSEWELKGTPAIIVIGGFDVEKSVVTLKMRDENEKKEIPLSDLQKSIDQELQLMHTRLYENAHSFLQSRIREAQSVTECTKLIEEGYIVKVPFCADESVEKEVEQKYGISTRCIAQILDLEVECIFSQKKTNTLVYFAKSY